MNGFNKASNSNGSTETANSGQSMKMSNGHRDFANQLCNGSPSGSSTSYGGARPKTREFDDNIPNGSQQLHQSHHSLPNESTNSFRPLIEIPPGGLCENQNNLSEHCSKVTFPKRDMECQAGPSQPLLGTWSENVESDASRLAAVCAASSRRAIAERARRAESGVMKRLCSPVDSDSSSDTGNDDALSGDECCIYTYKGDQNADLSNGLLGLSLPQANDHPAPPHPADEANRDGGSSPEMDFLEMDFDPDPLGEQDSVEEDNVQVELLNRPDLASSSPSPSREEELSNELSVPVMSSEGSSSEQGAGVMDSSDSSDAERTSEAEPNLYLGINVGASTSASSMKNSSAQKVPACVSKEILRGQHIAGSQLCSGDIDDTQELPFDSVKSWHTDSEPVLDRQKFNLYSALYHSIMTNNLILDEEDEDAQDGDSNRSEGRQVKSRGAEERTQEGCTQKKSPYLINEELPELEKTMIWTEKEAGYKQVSQIAVSACGAAAVSNVLCALNVPFSSERVHEGVATRLRAEKACLPTYLFSRSAAGAAHVDLIRGLELASDRSVYSRFFHMFPERAISLSRWLAHWLKQGAVPIATLNIQKSVVQGATIPDSWHHQMIFGVSHRGIYLTNPLECMSEEVLQPQLCSPSELLVRRQDIVSRWTPDTALCRLATSSDIRWKQMNVLGQVVNILRESNARPPHYLFRRNLTSHVNIPASYCSGILLSVMKDSPAATLLQSAPELPLKVS